jgi:type IV pilus assembly protein PilY1
MIKCISSNIPNLFISTLSSVFVVLILLSSAVMAEDTEIYFGGGASNDALVRPNVLLVLDTSSSMTSTDGTGITRLDRMKTALHTIISGANNVNMGLMRFHREGGPVLYPVANLDASSAEIEGVTSSNEPLPLVYSRIKRSEDDAQEFVTDTTVDLTSAKLSMAEKPVAAVAAGVTTLEILVASGNDDAEEEDDGDMYRISSDLELVKDGGRGDQTIGIRFLNVNIPAGATITDAEIEFTIKNHKDEATNLTIVAEETLNPSSFSGNDNDITDRLANATSSLVSWNAVDDPDDDEKLISPSLTSLVNELIGQPGWAGAGHTHDMVFIIRGSGKRRVWSYNGSGTQPLLRITYSTGSVAAATTEEQLVGLRFEDVGVPQGATITDAYIEFSAAAANSDATSLVITAENVDDSATSFTAVAGNLSARAVNSTSASVNWDPVEPWIESEHYLTSDLKTVVQEVVNRSGWCGNNAMSFFVKGGSGLREAVAYDGNTAAAPVLHINYDEDSVASGACINQTFQAQVATGSNDVEQKSDGTMYSNSSDLELTDDGGAQTIGLRFTNIKIPQGTTILEAYLDFTAKNSHSGSTSLAIKGEKSADAGAFTSSANDLTSRTLTSASTAWSPGAWTEDEAYTSPDLQAVIQEIVNQAAWDGGNALNIIISGSGLRRAWSSEGQPASAPVLRIKVNGELSTGFKTVRDRLHDIVTELNWKSGTPLVDTLYEAALYYRGDDVFYGDTRGNSHSGNNLDDRSKYTRVSHPASYTGGTVVRDAGCTDDNLNSTSCISEQITGTATYKSPMTLECQNNYMILLSDGRPSVNTSAARAVNLIGESCSGSGSGQCGPEIANFLYTEDQSDSLENNQIVKTYTIGFNIVSEGKTYLESVAAAGGGDYQDAGSAADLVTAFENIIADILDRPTSFASPSLSINAFTKLNHNNEIYFSLFKPDRNRRWNGNLKKYKVCSGTEVDGDGDPTCEAGDILDGNDSAAIGSDDRIKDSAQSIWSTTTDGSVIQEGGAGSKLPGYSSRKLLTYTGSTAPSSPVILDSSAHSVWSSNSALVGLIGNNLFNHASPYSSGETTEINELINWMRGRDVKDENEDGSTTDNRWLFSDPLHTSAIAISYGYPVDGDGNPYDGADADDDIDFVTKLLVTTNDGTLRMVNAHNGIEEWAFIPQALLDQQKDQMNNINGDHLYGLDVTPTIRVYDANDNGIIEPAGTDINLDGSISTDEKDFVYAYVAMRRGGRNIYAFDITPSATLTDRTTTNAISPKLLWRIEGGSGDFAALGETWSKPFPAKINYNGTKKDVLIFAGGYHTSQDNEFGVSAYGNAIYIVDANDGTRLWWASNTGANLNLTDMTYAIPSDIALIDANSDGLIERLYVGDTGGQLWRIDLASTLNSSTGARLAAISSSAADADKRKFFYPPDVAQMNDSVFSNTSLYDLVAITSGNRSHPLDTSAHDQFYAFRDTHIDSPIPSGFTPMTASDMLDLTDINLEVGSSAATTLKSKKGWYINFQEYDDEWAGEKGLANPLILDGKIFFTTYIPNETAVDDPCKPAVEGNGRLYAINLLTGAAVYDDLYTADSDGDQQNLTIKDRRDNLGGGIPSSADSLFLEGGVYVIVGTGGGATVFNPKVGLLRKRTFWQQQNIN